MAFDLPPNGTCIVTTHSPSGKAVFTDVPSIPPQVGPTGAINYFYTTTESPITMTGDADIKQHASHVAAPPRVVVPNGTAAMFVDLKPGCSTAMHRTVSLDYGTVIEGEVELELDDGEVRRARRGDLVVQRGTVHKWTNVTPDGGWLKMFFVTLGSKPVEVNGQELVEEWRTPQPVKESNL